MNRDRIRRVLPYGIAAGLFALLLVVTYGVIPWILTLAHAGRITGPVGSLIRERLLEGLGRTSLESYLERWSQVASSLVAAGAIVVTLGLGLFLGRRQIGQAYRDWRSRPPEQTAHPTSSLLLVAMWAGVLVGTIEIGAVAVRERLLGEPQWFYEIGLAWMTPTAYVLLFGAFAGILTGFGALRGRSIRLDSAAFPIIWMATHSAAAVLLPFVHPAAAALLSLGVAVRLSRPVVRSASAVVGRRRSALIGVATIILVGLLGAMADRRSGPPGSSSQGAPAAGAPNVLLIVWDTVRALSLSTFGFEHATSPRLSELAEGGVRFTRALSPSSWTLTSHASLFTGRYPHELSVGWESPLDGEYATLAEVLGSSGYSTGGFAANLYYTTPSFGLARGFDHYEALPVRLSTLVQSAWLTRRSVQWARSAFVYRRGLLRPGTLYRLLARKDAYDINREFLDWVEGVDGPFFAFLNYYDAHDPYMPPAEFDRFGPARTISDPWIEPRPYSEPEIEAELAAYHGSIAHLDDALARLLDSLDDSGRLDNTIVIVTSDHGEEFAEHGSVMGHGGSLYLPSVHVPLVVSWPGRLAAGTVVGTPVSIRDVAPTILDLADVSNPDFPDNSLSGLMSDSRQEAPATEPLMSLEYRTSPAAYPLSKGDMRALAFGDHYYVLNGDGSDEFFVWPSGWGLESAVSNESDSHQARLQARNRICAQLDSESCTDQRPN